MIAFFSGIGLFHLAVAEEVLCDTVPTINRCWCSKKDVPNIFKLDVAEEQVAHGQQDTSHQIIDMEKARIENGWRYAERDLAKLHCQIAHFCSECFLLAQNRLYSKYKKASNIVGQGHFILSLTMVQIIKPSIRLPTSALSGNNVANPTAHTEVHRNIYIYMYVYVYNVTFIYVCRYIYCFVFVETRRVITRVARGPINTYMYICIFTVFIYIHMYL